MTELPSGAVTFLFTDIEGSTPLWERDANSMQESLAKHNAILYRVIQEHGGQVFKFIGDAIQAVFPLPTQAVEAAIAAQRSLASQTWASTGPIRVRMGIHTGLAEAREGEYGGNRHELNRVARIMSAGHGGQILVSKATVELVRGRQPSGVRFRDMDEHTLKGLVRREHIFQVVAPELPVDFPPLNSEDKPRHNLPPQLTSFVGREKEIARIKDLLGRSRLVTLTGSGGVGKTRLAIQVAEQAYPHYPHGVWFVELASLSSPDLVPQALAAVFGLREDKGRSPLDQVVEYLGTRQLLLVLDNCEHLVETCAHLAHRLLHACPEIRILASSREGLGIDGELAYALPSLSSPDPLQLPPPEVLSQYEAVQLFAERARAVLPDFEITQANAHGIAQVTRRLDGIPLAIELAAARVKVLRVEQIADRLDECFRLLTGGSRTALPRHQTLRALIDWSYGLLSAVERVLLRRLAVFSGGWTLEAAEIVCSSMTEHDTGIDGEAASQPSPESLHPADVLDVLTQLINKSMVVANRGQGEETRYYLLETIRQYAREKLLESGESERLRSRHLEFFLAFAERAEPELWRADQKRWLDRLQEEHDNLRSALEWTIGRQAEGSAEAGLKILIALEEFWWVRGHWSEARSWLAKVLDHPRLSKDSAVFGRGVNLAAWLAFWQGDFALAHNRFELAQDTGNVLDDKRVIADALRGLGALAFYQNQFSEARTYSERSLELFRETSNQPRIAAVLRGLGNLAMREGQSEQAQACFQESLRILRDLGGRIGIATTLKSLGEFYFLEGHLDQARPHFEESLAIYRDTGDRFGIAVLTAFLGDLHRYTGDLEQAGSYYEQALSLHGEIGDKIGSGYMLCALGFVALRRRDIDAARRMFEDCLAIALETGEHGSFALALTGLAGVDENAEMAARLLGAAESYLDVGSTAADRADFDRILAATKASLSEPAFAAAWEEGQTTAAGGMEQAKADLRLLPQGSLTR
jgi:predicted ATPase/class 3 adenylate cyclase/Tfp pilus assembly protein PilF